MPTASRARTWTEKARRLPALVVLALLTSALDTACQAGLDCGSADHCDDAAGGAGGNAGLTAAGSSPGGVANLGGGVSAQAGSNGAASNGGSATNGGGAVGGDVSSGGNGGAVGGNGAAMAGNAGAGMPNHGGSSPGGTSGSTGSGGSAGSSSAAGSGGKAGNGGTSNGGGSAGTSNGGKSSGGTSSGGASGSSGASGSGGSGQVDPYASARQTCVDRVNQLRATKGLGAIPRLASAESCADGQAKTDSQTGMAHSAFNACLSQVQGWTGAAQNECPGWGSVADTLSGCIDAMWGEGPGGGHYDNMVGDYDDIACGFYTTPQGKVWMVQDFWRK
jgi:hypothetical protein